ncbi:MAG: hypothetical protein HYW28_10790 [Rhodospirillales bacterium]|nr:hypothetical protein [Rhodospirillales bacterium]
MVGLRNWLKSGAGAAALAAVSMAGPALAAPQIVAAVPSNGPIALVCDADGCVAEISTICLQRARAAPPPATRYAVHAADRAAIAVIGVRADGREIALDAGVLDFQALRGQVAFRVALPRKALEQLGLAGVSIRVERPAMLVPAAEPGDGEPQTSADIERAAGEMAATTGYWLELNHEAMTAARVAGRIVNRLPQTGSIGPDKAENLWRQAVAPEGRAARRGDTIVRARHMVEFCRTSAFEPGRYPMRRCLALFHDRTLQDLNRGYWNALKPQS